MIHSRHAVKSKVALAALKSEETRSQTVARFGINRIMFGTWKRWLQDNASDIF